MIRNDQERGLRAHRALRLAEEGRQADQMAIGLALVDVGVAQRGHAVLQHALRVGPHETAGIALAMVVDRGDRVQALLDEEVGQSSRRSSSMARA